MLRRGIVGLLCVVMNDIVTVTTVGLLRVC